MSRPTHSRRNRYSENLDKELLRKSVLLILFLMLNGFQCYLANYLFIFISRIFFHKNKLLNIINGLTLFLKLYSESNSTQHELMKFPLSMDHKDNIIKDSISFISNNQNYTKDDISKAFKFLCNNSEEGVVNLRSLAGFLEEQGENFYTGVEMISLLDQNNKGFVSMDDFFNFFQKGVHSAETQIPSQMKKDRQIVKAIQNNYDGLLKDFQDPQYCQYASKEIKRFKYSQKL